MKQIALSTIAGVTLLGTASAFAGYDLTIDNLIQKLSDTENMVQSYVNGKKEEIATLSGNIENLQTEIAGKIEELTQANEDKENLQNQLNSANATIAEKDAKITELETNVNDLTAQLEAAGGTNADLEALIESKNTQIETLTQEKADLEANVNTLTADLEAANTTISELRGTIESKNTEIEGLEQQIAELEAAGNEDAEYILYLEGLVNNANTQGNEHYETVAQILEEEVQGEVGNPENGMTEDGWNELVAGAVAQNEYTATFDANGNSFTKTVNDKHLVVFDTETDMLEVYDMATKEKVYSGNVDSKKICMNKERIWVNNTSTTVFSFK